MIEIIQQPNKKNASTFKRVLLAILIIILVLFVFYYFSKGVISNLNMTNNMKPVIKNNDIVQEVTAYSIDNNRSDFNCISMTAIDKDRKKIEYKNPNKEDAQKIRENCIPIER